LAYMARGTATQPKIEVMRIRFTASSRGVQPPRDRGGTRCGALPAGEWGRQRDGLAISRCCGASAGPEGTRDPAGEIIYRDAGRRIDLAHGDEAGCAGGDDAPAGGTREASVAGDTRRRDVAGDLGHR